MERMGTVLGIQSQQLQLATEIIINPYERGLMTMPQELTVGAESRVPQGSLTPQDVWPVYTQLLLHGLPPGNFTVCY